MKSFKQNIEKIEYTKEEIQYFNTLRTKATNIKVWGSFIDGKIIYIPFRHLKLKHIINIIAHIKLNKNYFSDKILIEMQRLLKRKQIKNTINGSLFYE